MNAFFLLVLNGSWDTPEEITDHILASPAAALIEHISSAEVILSCFTQFSLRKNVLFQFVSYFKSRSSTLESFTLLIAHSGEYLTFPIWKAECSGLTIKKKKIYLLKVNISQYLNSEGVI